MEAGIAWGVDGASTARGDSSSLRAVRRENTMPDREDEAWVQLATRIPKTLHRELKLHCVHADTSVMEFVVEALREKLAKASGRRRAMR
jgi:hypothetical protein